MSLDQRLFDLLHHRAGQWPLLDRPAYACARYGSWGEIGLMLMVSVTRARSGRRALRRCLAAVGCLYLLVEAIGEVARRARPFAASQSARALLEHSPERSFP